MDDFKPLLTSKTVWAGLIGLAASVFGVLLTPENQAATAELVVQVITGLAGVVALYGRVPATKRIE